ncbi:MAG: tRNA threonylcarbamoyladenosine dehydratase [Bacilli bacterium]|nr:tRNA threonylcarbamoyladenosine dehydratase [Bacilli bacterium]
MFDRLLKVINKKDFTKINNNNILIIGIGGVGGYALEVLARIGILNFTIVDNDKIEKSNLNRQIISLHSNIGKYKVDVAKERILDINPKININTCKDFITKDNIDKLFIEKYDYIIDACDTITTKVLLIKYAKERNIPIISSMGTGNRLDPTKLEITDIYKTNYDPLSKVMRKLLKEENIRKQDVIYSKEIPVKTINRTPGSTSLVPSVAGIYAAYYVINKILKDKREL